AVFALDADDDDAVALAQIRVHDRRIRERRPRYDGDFFHRQLDVVGAGRQLDEVHDRRAQGGLRDLHAADLVRRDHPTGAGALQRLAGVLGLGAADDEQIRPHHTGAQHGVDVLRIGPDYRDQPAGALDADPFQHVFTAGVGFDGQRALFHRDLHALGVALHDDVGHALPPELLGDDAAD